MELPHTACQEDVASIQQIIVFCVYAPINLFQSRIEQLSFWGALADIHAQQHMTIFSQ
jgi:hypothetical protein